MPSCYVPASAENISPSTDQTFRIIDVVVVCALFYLVCIATTIGIWEVIASPPELPCVVTPPGERNERRMLIRLSLSTIVYP